MNKRNFNAVGNQEADNRKKSMKISYMVTGRPNYPVLPSVVMKCHHCNRVMILKNFRESELLDTAEQDKYYI